MIDECKACGVIAELTEWEGWPRGTHKHLCVFCANTEAGAVLDDDRNYTEDQRLMLRTMSRIGHVLLVKLGNR
jgi:hypothetical protein